MRQLRGPMEGETVMLERLWSVRRGGPAVGLALAMFVLAGAPARAFAEGCPSGATRERGRCACPAGTVLSPDGRRCEAKKTIDKLPKVARPTTGYTPTFKIE